MSVLVVEVALTRVFSFMSWYHFAYLIISLALLGFGAAGSYLTVSPRFTGKEIDNRVVGCFALAFSLAIVIGFFTATKVRFYPMDAYTYGDYSNVYSLLLLYIVIGAQFFFAGTCIGYLISRAGEAINRFYFADLLGAGAGALLSILGVNYLGAEATIYGAAAVAGLVAVIHALKTDSRRLKNAAMLTLGLATLLTLLASKNEIFPVYSPPGKMFRTAMEPHYYRWHTVARIDVGNPMELSLSWEMMLSRNYAGYLPFTRMIFQDGGAPTHMYRIPNGEVKSLPILAYDLRVAPFVVKANPAQTLVIGVGGGLDVLTAIYYGARQVVGVEINPVTVDVIKNRYADFNGFFFHRPDVRLVNVEGRHYLTASEEKFDVIQLTGVDTYTALSSGAYVLTENYLYTTAAMRDYWQHLTDDGILAIHRWVFDPPRETLRLASTQIEALRREGIEDPSRQIMVFATQEIEGVETRYGETLLKKVPFTISEVKTLRGWARYMGFDILYDPYQEQVNAFNSLIRSPINQRAAFIDDYLYDIRPCSDDNPFFFRFYRWKQLFHPSASHGGYGLEHIPLALAVLLVSLVQILILAAVFVIGPLMTRRDKLREVPHKGRIFVYFGALGLGFITVEIVLLQKYTVFVGGPVYSMAVTLSALLAFSGVGSLLSKRLARPSASSLILVILALVAAIVGEMMLINFCIPKLMFLSQTARCGVVILALAPLAMLMGMPFPIGLRVTQLVDETIIPWAWGINAVTTTLGSLTCVLVSMEWGFTLSLSIAVLIYLIGLGAFNPVARKIYGHG